MQAGCLNCQHWRGPTDEEWAMLHIDTPTESVQRWCSVLGDITGAWYVCAQWETKKEDEGDG